MVRETVVRSLIGHMPGGDGIHQFHLLGKGGARVQVMELGVAVTRLDVPDRRGQVVDVVLGHPKLEDYWVNTPYFGVEVGRVAGRVPGSKVVLDGHTWNLPKNDGDGRHIHGGALGFHRKRWTGQILHREDHAPSVGFRLESPALDEGYPGRLIATLQMTLKADNSLWFETEAVSDAPTVVNMTHHGYFNLAGAGCGDIMDHRLRILSQTVIAMDETFNLLHRRVHVHPENDFNQERLLGEAVPKLFRRHGDLYHLDGDYGHGSKLRPVAWLHHPESGRFMTVSTDEPYLQLYTGLALEEKTPGKDGKFYGPHAGLCLECQGYPGGAERPDLGSIVLRPGEVLRRTTVYGFSVRG